MPNILILNVTLRIGKMESKQISQTSDNKKNNPSSFKLYTKNVKSTFFSGYNYRKDSATAYESPLVWILHTALLPVSLTIGAGALTFYELHNRNLLSEEQIKMLKLHLEELDPKQFDQMVLEIIDRPVKFTKDIYDLTKDLQSELKIYNYEAGSLHQDLDVKLREDFKQLKEKQLLKEANQHLLPKNKITTIQIELKQDDLNEINTSLSTIQQHQQIDIQKRIKQKELIISYINNNLNAGSEMVNHVNDMVNTLSLRA